MRQIGSLDNQRRATLFIDFLVTEKIAGHAESEGEGYAIWVRDEADLAAAREHFELFVIDPEASRYREAAKQAESVRRELKRQQAERQGNLVDVRDQWQQGAARKAPVVFLLIAASVAVTLYNGFERNMKPEVAVPLAFAKPTVFSNGLAYPTNAFASVQQGEVWRLVTPIFVHLGSMHLLMNMLGLWYLGSIMESQMGSGRFALLALLLAVLPNCAQAAFVSPAFGGISGVVFGLFGYLWIKTSFDPRYPFRLSQMTIIFVLGYFFLGAMGVVGGVANWAHGAGLLLGAAVSYLPLLSTPPKSSQ